MLCIENPHTDVYFNLAAEEYLLKNFSEDIFMLYQNEPSVVLGKYQDVNTEVNLAFAKMQQIKIARRISGGGTVFHDSGNLNISFIENAINPDFTKFANRIVDFLFNLGIQAELDNRQGITINGLKISGSAQYIFKNRALFHATLLYSSNLIHLTSVLSAEEEQFKSYNLKRPYVKSVKSPVTNVIKYLKTPPDINVFKKTTFNHFLSKNPNNTVYTFNSDDISHINSLKEMRVIDMVVNK